MSRSRVGIFVGAFDPIHDGHVRFAALAIKHAGFDKIFFAVEPRPRHKQGVKAIEHRTAMAQLALRHEPRFGLLMLDENRPSILETWPRLQARFHDAELVLLMGDDAPRRLSHWPRVDELATHLRFAVGTRKEDATELQQHLRVIAETRHLSLAFDLFKVPEQYVSSLAVRRVLRRGQRPEGLDDQVWNYIVDQRLYSSTAE